MFSLDIQRDLYRLALLGEAGQDFDEAPQECLARHQQVEQHDQRGEQAARHRGGAAEQRPHHVGRVHRRSLRRARAGAGQVLQLVHHPFQRADRTGEEGELLLDLRQRLRQFAGPGRRGPGDTARQRGERQREQQDRQGGAQSVRHAEPVAQTDQRLQQQFQHDRQNHGQHDRRGDVKRRQQGEQEQSAQEDRAWLGGERHVVLLLGLGRGGAGVADGLDGLVLACVDCFHLVGTHADAPFRPGYRNAARPTWFVAFGRPLRLPRRNVGNVARIRRPAPRVRAPAFASLPRRRPGSPGRSPQRRRGHRSPRWCRTAAGLALRGECRGR